MKPLVPFALLALSLCACPQHVDSLDGEDGTHEDAGGAVPPDAAVPPPVTCPAGGPVVTCHADRTEPLLRADAVVTVSCDKTAGTFAAPRASPEGLSVDDRLAAEGKLVLKLPAARVGVDFADTTFALDVVAEGSGSACGTARVSLTYAGDLWVADPSAGTVKAISSAGRLLGDALHGFAEPRLVAPVPGGMLIGGARSAGGQTELLVYSRQGQVVRGPFVRGPGGTDLLGSSAPHTAAVAADGTLYVTLGAGDGPGRLLSYSADGTAVKEVQLPSGASPRGVAILPSGQVIVGVLDQNGGFATLGVAPTNVIRPAYRDSDSTSACSPSGTVAVLPTDAALFLSTRDPGPWGVAGGLVALSPGDFSLRGYSPHSHGAGTTGALFPKPPDWLAEVSTGVFAAGWAGATGVELFDVTLSAAGRRPGWGGYKGQPAGMARLR